MFGLDKHGWAPTARLPSLWSSSVLAAPLFYPKPNVINVTAQNGSQASKQVAGHVQSPVDPWQKDAGIGT